MESNCDDKLKALFRQIPLSKPQSGFDKRLMQHIHQYEKKRKKHSLILNVLAISGGIVAMLTSPFIILYCLGYTSDILPKVSLFKNLDLSLPTEMHINSLTLLPFGILFLLIADLLIRKKKLNGKNKA